MLEPSFTVCKSSSYRVRPFDGGRARRCMAPKLKKRDTQILTELLDQRDKRFKRYTNKSAAITMARVDPLGSSMLYSSENMRHKLLPRMHGMASTDMVEEYEEMRHMLSELIAQGVQMPNGPWQQETVGTHLHLTFQHIARAMFVACCPVSWRAKIEPVRASQGQSSSYLKLDDGNEVELDEQGTPLSRALAARWLIMPIGTWKEKWDIFVLFLIIYSAVVVPLRVCFEAEADGFMWMMELSMTLAFILDMLFTFSTVYFDPAIGVSAH